jgi:hypothetical protein
MRRGGYIGVSKRDLFDTTLLLLDLFKRDLPEQALRKDLGLGEVMMVY